MPRHDRLSPACRKATGRKDNCIQQKLKKRVVYASFNPAPRWPRNSTPLAVSMKADLTWLSVGPT